MRCIATSTLCLLSLAFVSGCQNTQICRVGTDCTSGVCRADGQCAPEAAADAGTDGRVGNDARASDVVVWADTVAPIDVQEGNDLGTQDVETDPGRSAPDVQDDARPSGGGCLPGHDGVVGRDEIPLQPGLSASWRVAFDAPFETAPARGDESTPAWDLAVALPGDEDRPVTTLDVADTWFADDFPDATYATALSHGSDLLGVFRATDEALLLLGVVSPEDGLFATRLEYDPPVETLRFPLEVGAQWSTESTVSGTAQGVLALYSERYDVEVDHRGALATPFGAFDALRVRVTLTRQVGLLPPTTTRTFVFVAECFGTIARIVSEQNETNPEFVTAAEIGRIRP